MKNLRKVLAVVLVVALAFSLMAIASANFSDNDKIKYSEAVGVMTGIGAINGMPDGSFDPQGLVTRAEAAKMITYAILGPSVAASLSKTTSTFSDVPTTYWASSFIQYCASKGIINGTGDGTFNPEGNVTGVELAKMMLCAAGYGVNKEFVGTDWAINVITYAMQNNVFKGNTSADFSVAATREEAALYIFNGIFNVHQVAYNDLFGYYGKGQAVTSATPGNTIAVDVYKMTNDKGVVIANDATGGVTPGTSTVDKADVSIDGKVTDLTGTSTYKFASSVKEIGQLVSIFYATDTQKVFFTQTISSTVSVAADTSTANGYFTAFGSLTFGPAAKVYNFDASYATPNKTTTISGLTMGTIAKAGTYATYGGQILSFIPSGTSTFEKVTAISTALGSESITLSGSGLLSNTAASDVVKEYSGIAVGDYVTVTRAGTMYNLAKCTTVDGTISGVGYFLGAPSTVTMNGTVYNAAATATNLSGLVPSWPATTDFTKNTYTLYLDSNGKFVTCTLKEGSVASPVVFATGAAYQTAGDYGMVWKVQAVNTSGEQVVYTNADGQTDVGGVNNIAAKFYKVTTDATTGLTTFDPSISTSDFAAPATGGSALTSTTAKDGSNYYFASDTKFIFVNDTGAALTVTKLTGLSAVAGITLNNTDMLFFNNTPAVNKTVNTVIVSGAFTGASNVATVFIPATTGIAGTNVNGTEYNVYIDGVLTKITSVDSNLASIDAGHDNALGKFASYVINDKGAYDFTGLVNDGTTDQALPYDGVYGTYVNGLDASGAKVVDLTQNPGDPAVYTSIATLESYTHSTSFTISYVTDVNSKITSLYVVDKAVSAISDTAIENTTTNLAHGSVDVVLSFTAPSAADNGATVTYQWYKNTTNSTTGGTAISGATTDTYTLPTTFTAAGDVYYYCVVSASGNTSVASNVLTISLT